MGRPGEQLIRVPKLDMVTTGYKGTNPALNTIAFQENREVKSSVPSQLNEMPVGYFGDFTFSISHGIILSTPGRIHTITQFESEHLN